MTHRQPVHDVHETSSPRRDFLRSSILLALPAVATAAAPSLAAATMRTAAYSPPQRYRGSTEINVRNRGARGNGSHDDTAAFQNAINALPASGGTVIVPAGTYLIDPTRMVRLRSRMHLKLASGAVLKAKANAQPRAYVLMLHKIEDVVVSGGEILGDRDRHKASTGQWGHGIMVRGSSRVTIRDMLIRKCWGDGISIAASTDANQVVGNDIVIANVACIGNRRQGMSIGQARNVKVHDSEFSYTGGAFPGCGIDLESDFTHPGASNTHIENCVFQHNEGNGIQIYKRSVDTTVLHCRIKHNHGYGVLAMGTRNALVRFNNINNNGLIGVGIRAKSRGCDVSRNTFYNNARRFRSRDLPRLTPARARAGNVLDRHTEIEGSTNCHIWTNFYRDK